MQGFVNNFANQNCVLKDISVKGFENVLQIFLRWIRLLTRIAHVNHLSVDIWHRNVQLHSSRSPEQFQAIKIAAKAKSKTNASILQNFHSFIMFLCKKSTVTWNTHMVTWFGTWKLLTGRLTLSIGKIPNFFFPLMMSHHAKTRGIYLFAQCTAMRTSFSGVDQPV